MKLDLGSLDSVREFVAEFEKRQLPLHVLINNAGISLPQGTVEKTADGFEAHIGVNHLGPFLLTNLLLPKLKESSPSRIVNVASRAHRNAPTVGVDFETFRPDAKDAAHHHHHLSASTLYGQSKLANILFTYELDRRLCQEQWSPDKLTVNCLHPGVIDTPLLKNLFPTWTHFLYKPISSFITVTPQQGAATTLHVATSPQLDHVSGKYFSECKETQSSQISHDESLAKRLWDVSAEMVGFTNVSNKA